MKSSRNNKYCKEINHIIKIVQVTCKMKNLKKLMRNSINNVNQISILHRRRMFRSLLKFQRTASRLYQNIISRSFLRNVLKRMPILRIIKALTSSLIQAYLMISSVLPKSLNPLMTIIVSVLMTGTPLLCSLNKTFSNCTHKFS